MSTQTAIKKKRQRQKTSIVAAVIVTLLLLLHFVPVSRSDTPCGEGESYRIVLGQLGEYLEAKDKDQRLAERGGLWGLGCAQYIHPYVDNALYVL